MAESLLEKAKRLNIQPSGESLLQKAERLGIQPASQAKEPNYFQRVGQSFQREAGAITTGVERGAEAITDLTRSPVSRTGELLRTGLETAGGVARGAFAPILEAPIIKQAVSFVTGKLVQVPQVEKVISSASELAKKYPKQARDIQNIVDIASLGYAPKVSGVLSKEAKAIGSDIAQGTKIALNASEEAVQADIVTLFQKSIKPTAKKTLIQADRYENDILNALKTIKSNADNLNVEDVMGELVARTPQTLNELSQALDQTKRLVFSQYDDLARQAGTGGAVVDARPIADEVLQVAQNKALQITNPELIKYAETWAERLRGFGEIDTQTAQEVVKTLNNSLSAFYKNPTYESASKVAIDAGIVNNFRKALDDAIEGATGQEYQALKNQYGSLKAIENDVVRASMRDARKNAKGLLDYTDIFTSGQMIGGILSLNPAMFTKGAIERGFKEYFKFLNDPNRAVGNMFDLLDTSTVQPFSPTSATFNLLKNPKLGMSIEDVSKSPLAQEARKYATADEFVKGFEKRSFNPFGMDDATIPKADIKLHDAFMEYAQKPEVQKIYQSGGNDTQVLKQFFNENVKSSIPKGLSSLATEARKYKTADEFVAKIRGSSTQYGDYTPQFRHYGMEDYKNISELGVKPDEMVTIYRGIDRTVGKVKRQINDGDFVTADYDSALSYTGDAKDVVSMEVPAKTLYTDAIRDFKEEPFYTGSEYVYTKQKVNPLTKSQLTDFYNKVNKKK